MYTTGKNYLLRTSSYPEIWRKTFISRPYHGVCKRRAATATYDVELDSAANLCCW